MSQPTKPTRLLDPRFKYVPAKDTNIRKTFKRIKRELAEQAEAPACVVQIRRRTA